MASTAPSTDLGRKAKRRREFLIIAVPVLVSALASGAVSFGLNPQLVWIPSVVLFLWPIFLLTEKFPDADEELSFLQSVRATEYFAGLLVMVPVNTLLITPSNPITILLTPVASAILIQVVTLVVRSTRRELELFDLEQKKQLTSVLREAGVAVIWLSAGIALADYTILVAGPTINAAVYAIPSCLIMGYVASRNEGRSSRFSTELAASLKRSRWSGKRKFRKSRRR